MFFPLTDLARLGADILMPSGDSNSDLPASECGGTDSRTSSVPGPEQNSQTNSFISLAEQEKQPDESTENEIQKTTSAPIQSPHEARVRSSDSSQSNRTVRRPEAISRRQNLGKEQAPIRSRSGEAALTAKPLPKCNAFQEMNDALESLLEASDTSARRVNPGLNHAPKTTNVTHARKYSKSESVSLTKMTTRPDNRIFYFNQTSSHKDAKATEDGRNLQASRVAAKKTPEPPKGKNVIISSVSSTSAKRVSSKTPTRPAPKPETSSTSKSNSLKRPYTEASNRDAHEAKQAKYCDRIPDMLSPSTVLSSAKDSRALPEAHLNARIKNPLPGQPGHNIASAGESDNGQKISFGSANKSGGNMGDRKGHLPLAVLTQRWKSAKRAEATSAVQSVGTASRSLTPRCAVTQDNANLPKPVGRKRAEDIEQTSPIDRFRNAAQKFISASTTGRDMQDKRHPTIKSGCCEVSPANDLRTLLKIQQTGKEVGNQRNISEHYEKLSDAQPAEDSDNLAVQQHPGLVEKEAQSGADCKSSTSLGDEMLTPNCSKPCSDGLDRTRQSGSRPEGNMVKQRNLRTSPPVAPYGMVPVISLSWSRRQNFSSRGNHRDAAGAKFVVSLDEGLALLKEIMASTTPPGVDFILNQCGGPGSDATSKSSGKQGVESFTSIRFELIPNTRTQEKVDRTPERRQGSPCTHSPIHSLSDDTSETSSSSQTTARQAENRMIGLERSMLQGLENILNLPQTIRGLGRVPEATELYSDSNPERLQVLSLWNTMTSGIATFFHNSMDKLTVANEDGQSGKSNQDQNISNAIDLSSHGSILNQDNFESSCLSRRDKIVRMDSFMEFLARTSSDVSSSGSVTDEDLTDKIDDYLNNETLSDSGQLGENLQAKFAGKVNRWKELLNACKQRGAVTKGELKAQSLYNTTKLLVKRHKESGTSDAKLFSSRRSRLTADDVFKTKHFHTRDGQVGPKSGRRADNNHKDSSQPMHSIILRFSDSEDSDQGSNAGQEVSEPTGQKLDLKGETSVDSTNLSQSVDSEPYPQNYPDATPEPSSEECPDPSLETGSESIPAVTPSVKMSSFGPVCFKQYPHLVWTLRREEAVKQQESDLQKPEASFELIEDIELDFNSQSKQEDEVLQLRPLVENTDFNASDLETGVLEEVSIDDSTGKSLGVHLSGDDSLSENTGNRNLQVKISRENEGETTSIKTKQMIFCTEQSFDSQVNVSTECRPSTGRPLGYAYACASQSPGNFGNAMASCEYTLGGSADRSVAEFERTETGEKIMNVQSSSGSEGCDIQTNKFQEPRRQLTPIELGAARFKSLLDLEYSGEEQSDLHDFFACAESESAAIESKQRGNLYLAVSPIDSDNQLSMGQTDQCKLKSNEVAAIEVYETNRSLADLPEDTLTYQQHLREYQLAEFSKLAKGSPRHGSMTKVCQTKHRSSRAAESTEHRYAEASPTAFQLEVDSTPELLVELREDAKSGNRRINDIAEFGFTFDLSFNQFCDLPFQQRATHSGASSYHPPARHPPTLWPMSPKGGNIFEADPSVDRTHQAVAPEIVIPNGTFPAANGSFLLPSESVQTASGTSQAPNTTTTFPQFNNPNRKKKKYRKGKCKNHNACTADEISTPLASSSSTLETAIKKCAELFCSFSRNTLSSRLLPVTFPKPPLKYRRLNAGSSVDDLIQKQLRTQSKTSLSSTQIYSPASLEQTSAQATASTLDSESLLCVDSVQKPEDISQAEEPGQASLPSSSREFFTPSPGVYHRDISSGGSSFYSASPSPSVIAPGIDNLTFTPPFETQHSAPKESRSSSQQDEC